MTDINNNTPDAAALVEGWDLDQVVGQLFCVSVGHHVEGAYGFTDSVDQVAREVAELHLGGVCYFPTGEQGARPEAIADQVQTLQAASPTPLLMTIDQEGGLVTRMREPATRWPSAMAQAAAFGGSRADWGMVQRMARSSGEELAAVGVGQAYAPVADVNVEPNNPVIGIRSASSDPAEVAHFVTATVRGLGEAGVASCLKHFPGHGDTQVDSHVGLPTFETTLEDWWDQERIPFAAGIAAGVDAVMIGHLRAPGLDPAGEPATFSRSIVTGLLRERLGFEGVIVTDAMDMAGAQLPDDDHGRPGPAVACLRALKAGVDQVLMPRDARSAIAVVLRAVADGELDEAQLRASARRIVALKHRLGLLDRDGVVQRPDVESHRRRARMAQSRALTWRDQSRTLRLAHPGRVIILHDAQPPSAGRGVEDVPTTLAEALRARGFDVRQELLDDRRDVASSEGTRILVTRDAWRFPEVAGRVRAVAGATHVAVLARSPHDSALVPESVPTLLSYGDLPGVGVALADALIAGVAFGTLPIDLPSPDDERTLRWFRSGSEGADAPPAVSIRPYRPEDRDALGMICVRTGASGADATGDFFSDELLPWIYAYPYVEYEPESCLVVDVGGRAVGYILGVADVKAFAEWWQDNWRGPFATQFPEDATWTDRERALARKGLEPHLMVPPWYEDIPAELHIDLLPVVQGMGLGRQLVDRFRELMAARGVQKIGLGVGGTNTNAIAFYRRLGFSVLREHRNDHGETTGYAMWIATDDGRGKDADDVR